MKDETKAHELLAASGLLPEEMPKNYTFDKVREVLGSIAGAGEQELNGAVEAARRLGLRGPLAAAVFVRHHLGGAHEVEVDRVAEGEEGTRFAVLVYPEGEVALGAEHLPEGISEGTRLRYDPKAAAYALA